MSVRARSKLPGMDTLSLEKEGCKTVTIFFGTSLKEPYDSLMKQGSRPLSNILICNFVLYFYNLKLDL